MVGCPDFTHVVLVYVAHTRYVETIPALPSSQLTNPAAPPSISQPGPSAATKALDGQYGTPSPSTSPPTPPPSSFKHHWRVCGSACVRWDSQQPSARAQLPAPGFSTQHYQPLASFSAPESTGVEGIQVGRIASQQPFAGRRRRALACVSG